MTRQDISKAISISYSLVEDLDSAKKFDASGIDKMHVQVEDMSAIIENMLDKPYISSLDKLEEFNRLNKIIDRKFTQRSKNIKSRRAKALRAKIKKMGAMVFEELRRLAERSEEAVDKTEGQTAVNARKRQEADQFETAYMERIRSEPYSNNPKIVVVAGPAGAGKSTLMDFFREQGKIAVDADFYLLVKYIDENNTGHIPASRDEVEKLYRDHTIKGIVWDLDKLREFIDQNRNKEIYIFGRAKNMWEAASSFNEIYWLDADKELTLERLERRKKDGGLNTYGTKPEDRDYVVDVALPRDREWAREHGATFIDPKLPTEEKFRLITHEHVKAPIRRRIAH